MKLTMPLNKLQLEFNKLQINEKRQTALSCYLSSRSRCSVNLSTYEMYSRNERISTELLEQQK